MGRKSWLFAASVDGAKASASLYSLVETAKANGHEPHSYIQHVLTHLPAAQSLEDIEALLPFNLQPQQCLSGCLKCAYKATDYQTSVALGMH